MENKNFNPMACYAYLADAGVCAANVDYFVAGLKRYIANDPPIVFTPCPIVYFEPSCKQFFVLPFLCLNVPRRKIWGICIGSMFIKSGFNGPMTIEVAKKLLQREQNAVLGINSTRRVKFPTQEELEKVLAYDSEKFNNHWKALEIMKANGLCSETSYLSSLRPYIIVKNDQMAVFERYGKSAEAFGCYVDEMHSNSTRALVSGEKIYALQVLKADFSADKVGRADEYGFPDAETAKILSVLMEKN